MKKFSQVAIIFCLLIGLEVWGSWLWWMGFERGQQHMIEKIKMFAPETAKNI